MLLYRPYIKFNLNLFKLTHTLAFNYKFLLSPYIFLPTKLLSIRIFKNNIYNIFIKFYTYFIALSVLFLGIFFII